MLQQASGAGIRAMGSCLRSWRNFQAAAVPKKCLQCLILTKDSEDMPELELPIPENKARGY